MVYNFCTLFDKNFLARAVALHRSLVEQCSDFSLWMLCMDDTAYSMLEKLNLEKVKLLRLPEVEDVRLLKEKPGRTTAEYCWMFSSSLPLFLLEKKNLDHVTYIDADMYFYDSPEEIYRQFGDNSIMLIPHGFSEKHKHREKTSGIYNVGMMIFRNDQHGLECLRWWKDRVIEWCYNRFEDGKFGDQLYLNDWPTRFKKVFVLTHQGADVAGWNTDRFRFWQEKDERIMGIEKSSGKKFPLIFYHFHGLKIYMTAGGKVRPHPVTVFDRMVYKKYLEALNWAYGRIRTIDPDWSFGCVKKLDILRLIKQYIVLWVTK